MRIACVLTITLVTAWPAVARPQAQDPSPALRSMVQAYQTAWNAHDAGAVAAFFTNDADQILDDGPITVGREAVHRWGAARFARMEPGRRIALTITAVRPVTSGVAVINTIATTGGRTPEGHELASSTDRGTWVVVHQDGRWRLAALRVYRAEHAEQGASAAADRSAIDKAHETFVAGMRAGDCVALTSVLATDVVMAPPNTPTATGIEGFRTWCQAVFRQVRTTAVTISGRDVVVTGDWGIEHGTYDWTVVPVAGGAEQRDQGRFVAIHQRQPDNSWKLVRDIWNSSLPLSTVPAK